MRTADCEMATPKTLEFVLTNNAIVAPDRVRVGDSAIKTASNLHHLTNAFPLMTLPSADITGKSRPGAYTWR
jgi:hypothetical protein